jgi:hypothetical protein
MTGLILKRSTFLIWHKSKNHCKNARLILMHWVAFEDFAALHEGQIAIQFGLQKELMRDTVGPIQMVTARWSLMVWATSPLILSVLVISITSGCPLDIGHFLSNSSAP